MFAFAGPAYLVSVGYMDPGNWATDLEGGARFGYKLLWVLVLSNLMAILLQTLSARLGIVAGLAFVVGFALSQVNERKIIADEAVPIDSDGNPKPKKKRGSFELVHAVIPLALFAWKAFQSSRCERRAA